jgi:ribonuclease HII
MILADLCEEQLLWDQGLEYICGVDEVGRGCFAGPVVAGAVIFPKECGLIEGIADSKLLKSKKREDLEARIKNLAIAWAVSEVSVEIINQIGIVGATQLAYLQAIQNLTLQPDFYLIDAFYINDILKDKQKPIIRGDQKSMTIAAASIIAKVYRDKRMEELDVQFPGYQFGIHKGYGTRAHQKAIAEHGLSALHRKCFDLSKFL